MTATPTAPIPVTGLIEVKNSVDDTLCVSVSGKDSWSVQVIRGLGRRGQRGSSTAILWRKAHDEAALKAAVDEFLEGDYRGFEESSAKETPRRWVFLSMLASLFLMALALTFLAFMISVFLKLDW